MVRLDGEAKVDLLISSDGNMISLGKNHSLVSVDVPSISSIPKDEEIMLSSKSISITSENCMFDKRAVDYICGLLSPAEYKMPKKKHRKSVRIKKKLRKIQGIVLRMER